MPKETNWKSTIFACYRGNFTQASIVNLSPLLFVIFQNKFNLSYTMLASLILFNFVTQIVADLLSVKFVDKIGYRKAAVTAHIMAALGLILMAILPQILPSAFLGLAVSTMTCAFGGGICEVILSPIVEAIPGDAKASAMSLLHSMYSWGQFTVVLVTTLTLMIVGDDLWYIIPLIWATIPLYNIFSFLRVPLQQTLSAHEKTPLKEMFKSKIFIIILIAMLCAGASELAICQWSSLFFEKGLGVNKVLGDILGPCLFAITMGIGRTLFGIYGTKINLYNCLIISSILCIACYLGTALFSSPILALISCALCGLSVALMWPGSISTGAALFKRGGASLFGVMAVMGDVGASIGPSTVGAISDFVKFNFALDPITADTVALKVGILSAVIFPIILLFTFIWMKRYAKKHRIDVQNT